jgi:beta-glucanase (GH16 family)
MGGPGSSFPFTSGKITTGATLGSANQSDVTLNQVFPPKDFLGITTGYVEARIKAPKGRGFWPAFWLLGANTNEHNGFPLIGWPQCGEIDIMESAGGQEHLIHQTIHYGQGPFDYSRKWQKGTSYTINPSASDDYHIYGVGWESCGNTGGNTGQLRFYFNDELKFTQNFPLPEGERANSESFFDDVPFFIIFNLAIGGNFLPETDRNYLQSSTFTNPDWETRSLMVDWVRVYSGSKNAGDDGSF